MGLGQSKSAGKGPPRETNAQTGDSNKYLAKPSGLCCLKGTIHQGESRGKWETIADVETYISTPPEGKANGNILLYFPDVWGMFPNGLLVMDAFADAGYLVLGLDYFRGVRLQFLFPPIHYPFLYLVNLRAATNSPCPQQDPVWKHRKNRLDHSAPDFDYEAWKRKHTAFADEAVPKWVEAVKKRQSAGNTRYFCVGYCFGAPYVCNELAKDTVTAGAFAHPAFLKEQHFENVQSEIFR